MTSKVAPMTLVVDPWHWLTLAGEIPAGRPRLRRNVLNVARVVEYGATLSRGQFRETLLECSNRLRGARCQGLLWVEKRTDDSLLAFCPKCTADHLLVHNWQGTRWSNGQASATPESPAREEEYF